MNGGAIAGQSQCRGNAATAQCDRRVADCDFSTQISTRCLLFFENPIGLSHWVATGKVFDDPVPTALLELDALATLGSVRRNRRLRYRGEDRYAATDLTGTGAR
jgi:hypothetical protein